MKGTQNENDDGEDQRSNPEKIYLSSSLDGKEDINPAPSALLRHRNTELSDGSGTISSDDTQVNCAVTPYDRLRQNLANDHRVLKEITLGRRIAFYRIRGEIGTGNFSQVKLGIHVLTKDKVAIKILDKTKLDRKTQRLLSREITSMERLHHPNIIRLYEVVETLAKLYIVMEYAEGGELFTKVSNEGRLPEADARSIFAQVVAAVEHMHDNSIIHRDLKAENVFYATRRWIKVGDFGFSTFCPASETLNTFCGSPPYAAPELFKDENYCGAFVDIWAMGVLLFFIVTGLMPFRAETVAKLKKCILDGSYSAPSYVSDSCVFLIRGILRHVPSDRLTIAEIKRSEWLAGLEFPAALEQYNLNPSPDPSAVSSDEREARAILSDLGIKDEHLGQANVRDPRNNITGTYRIVLHRVQKRNSGVYEAGADSAASRKASSSNSVSEKRHLKHIFSRSSGQSRASTQPSAHKHRSRTCCLL